jgi:hypothetical protein
MGADAPARPPRASIPAIRALCKRIASLAGTAARNHGYAIGTHGSMARDCDLIAVPWTEDAAEPLIVVKAIQAAITAEIGDCYRTCAEQVAVRPHGRQTWVLHFQNAVSTTKGAFPWVDLSVVSPRPDPSEPA